MNRNVITTRPKRPNRPKVIIDDVEEDVQLHRYTYTGTIEKDIIDTIKKQARKEERSLNYIINRLIKSYYNELIKQNSKK